MYTYWYFKDIRGSPYRVSHNLALLVNLHKNIRMLGEDILSNFFELRHNCW
eukprot:COSAG01_NODE_32505_length_580_cov_0.667360_2_plen_50_part_01